MQYPEISMTGFQLDGVREASIVYPDYDLDKIDTIIIGGLLMDDENSFENTGNFSGCISSMFPFGPASTTPPHPHLLLPMFSFFLILYL